MPTSFGAGFAPMVFQFKDLRYSFPSDHCVIFGILNVTPDSFSDGGHHVNGEAALAHAMDLEKQGADVLDVGGESSRPGAAPISADEELDRVLPVLRTLRQHLPIPISIDTTKSAVAEVALAEGASIVNDVSGLQADPRMASVVAAANAGLILMHRRGNPQTMQSLCQYADVVADVKRELDTRFQDALQAGIPRDAIVVDPGIGFAKTAEQNHVILRHLRQFIHTEPHVSFHNRPVMVGLSRKSFLGGDVGGRAFQTVAAELWARLQGAHIVRTHDVAALRQALETLQSIRGIHLPPAPPIASSFAREL